jgi:hypothetical protein
MAWTHPIDPALLSYYKQGSDEKQLQILRLRLAQRTRQTQLRMTALQRCNSLGPDQ